MDEHISKLWEEYTQTKSKAIKDLLIVEYAPLVKYIAGRVSVNIGYRVDNDDLIGYGIFGLMDAIDKFDYYKGNKFETYASLRIRGSIIDAIRKMDWVPRDLRQKNKQLEAAYGALETEIGREPTEEELAAKLEITVEETKTLIKKAAIVNLISLDDYLEQNHEDTSFSDNESPAEAYDKKEIAEILAKAIDKLTDREKQVVTLYYFEDMTLKEIAKILDVSESRVSQLHSKAVVKLRTKLGAHRAMIKG